MTFSIIAHLKQHGEVIGGMKMREGESYELELTADSESLGFVLFSLYAAGANDIHVRAIPPLEK